MADLGGARGVALAALRRIEDGAYANLVVPSLLSRSGLSGADRRFVTDLVYGTTRMRRACDWLVDRYLIHPPDAVTRAVLRLGAYQVRFAGVAPHAAVSATVDIAPARTRGLVNAVLRKLAAEDPPAWPDEPTRLSYPDWIIERLTADLGASDARAALEIMNRPPVVTTRADGYTQDLASQWVAETVQAPAGGTVLDVCAAPGGKATWIAERTGAHVVAADIRPSRLAINRSRLALLVCADGTAPPWRPAMFDAVLVDAPCSGLGVLRRRPDARWRVGASDVEDLAALQRSLLAASAGLVAAGGQLVYSVCTLTIAETAAIDAWLQDAHPDLVADALPGDPWVPIGRGARLLPQAAGTDGMYMLSLRRTGS